MRFGSATTVGSDCTKTKMKTNKRLIALAVIVFLVLTQFYIFGHEREPWFDTSFSLETAHTLNEDGYASIDWQAYDVHPAGYYYALAGWQNLRVDALFTEYQWAQELSVLFGLLFLAFAAIGLYNFFPEIRSRWQYGFVVAALAVSTTTIHYSTEPRMYIMLLALAAIAFAAISKRMEGKWKYAGAFAVLLMPLTHYIASVGIVIFPLMHWFVNKDKEGMKELAVAGFMGFVATLFFAIPQRMRSTGTWFQNHDISSFPSALVYPFSTNGTMEIGHTQFTFAAHILILAAVVYVAYLAFDRFESISELNRSQRAWYFMFGTLLVPLGYLGFLSLGSGGFFNLYHHRFFLVVTWMFAAAVLITIGKWLHRANLKNAILGIVLVVTVIFGLHLSYAQKTHTELQNIAYETPCEMRDGSAALIGHESPFSGIPYMVFERERNCDWEHFISTNISKGLLNAGGYDAFEGEIYWNKTLPTRGFYYVESTGHFFNLSGRNSTVVETGPGIWLRYVYPEQSSITIQFGE